MTIEILIIALCILSVALLIQGLRNQKLEDKVYEMSMELMSQKAFSKSLDKQITSLIMRMDKPPEPPEPREVIIKDFKPIINYRRIDSKPKPKKQEPQANIPQPPDISLEDMYLDPQKRKSDR